MVAAKAAATEIVEEVVVEKKVKRERKTFELPGQTKELDSNLAESESLRIFYTTLREQRPDSEIAPLWLMQHGLLPEDEADELFKKVGAARSKPRATGGGSASPSKSPSAGKKRVRKPDPRRIKNQPAAAGGSAGSKGKAAAAPRKRPAKKAGGKPVVIDDDDGDDDDDFASKPPPAKKGKFVGKSAIIDDDDSD